MKLSDIIHDISGVVLQVTIVILFVMLGKELYDEYKTNQQLKEQPVVTHIVKDKYTTEETKSGRTMIMPVGNTVMPIRTSSRKVEGFGIIVDEQAYELPQKEWNGIKTGDTITYKAYGDKIKVLNVEPTGKEQTDEQSLGEEDLQEEGI